MKELNAGMEVDRMSKSFTDGWTSERVIQQQKAGLRRYKSGNYQGGGSVVGNLALDFRLAS